MRKILVSAVLAAVGLVGCGGGATTTGDAARGKVLFDAQVLGTTTKQSGCTVCHVAPYTSGPNLTGFGAKAAANFSAKGKASAHAYAVDSIIKPNEEIAPGATAGMPTNYGTVLSETDQNDLAAYLLSL